MTESSQSMPKLVFCTTWFTTRTTGCDKHGPFEVKNRLAGDEYILVRESQWIPELGLGIGRGQLSEDGTESGCTGTRLRGTGSPLTKGRAEQELEQERQRAEQERRRTEELIARLREWESTPTL